MAGQTAPPESMPDPLERRLATILTADVAGYSRMMGENEEATIQTLRGHRAVFDALLKQHHGRVFNTAGDAILAEFPSTVEAVRCATEIQAALQTRNEHLPPERKMLFRMGINLGDVVVQEGDLLGDGVNVATRIQTIAEHGGICISGSVFDQIQNKLSLQFKSLGNQNLKNIAQPVRTFSITQGESGVLPSRTHSAGGKTVRMVAIAMITVGAIAGAGYWFYRDHDERRREELALSAKLAEERKQTGDALRQMQNQIARTAKAESAVESDKAAPAKAVATPAMHNNIADTTPKHPAPPSEIGIAPTDRASATKQRGSVAVATGTAAVTTTTGKLAAPTPPATGAVLVDGTYKGQVCNFPQDAAKRTCWRVPLRVQNGAANGTWTLRVAGKPVEMHAAFAPDGSVKATLDGWKVGDGTPMTGAMNGSAANDHIDIEGRWSNGVRVDGHWERAR